MSAVKVVIVGGGLAGLCCAKHLAEKRVPFLLFEADQRVGGRVQTDHVDGFLLDRGFQVLLTAYPEARNVLDYDALQLGFFEPGALVRFEGKFHRFSDPWRRPQHLLATAVSPVASLMDKFNVAKLRRSVCRGTLDDLYQRPESTTEDLLRQRGFSDRIIERFFRPFLGGVFLEDRLDTSSRKFEFVFRMFAQGEAALPAAGMGAIASQLAAHAPGESIRTGTRVKTISENRVVLADGQVLSPVEIVLACDQNSACRLQSIPEASDGHSVTCLYFVADRPPIEEPILILNGDGDGPINNLCVPSQVRSSYAPAGKSLISVSVLSSESVDAVRADVQSQLQDWFGRDAGSWPLLAGYSIAHALPAQKPPTLSTVAKPVRGPHGILICGDYREIASVQGAMVTGRAAAEAAVHSVEC